MISVSIIIPTKNGEKYLDRVLNMLFSQETAFDFEVIIIDSGSKDKTLKIIKKYPAQLIKIRPREFGHGKTRNYGVGISKGKFLVFLTQDAIPYDKYWLNNLISTYELDNKIAGVYCRQIPRAFENPVSVEGIRNWVAGKDEFQIISIESVEKFNKLSPIEKRLKVNFDNVASAIRRDLWEKFPLPDSQFASDHQWGKTILLNDYKIAFQPSAPVIHSHDRSPLYEFKRRFIDHKVNYNIYGLQLFPNKTSLIKGILGDIKNKTKTVLKSNLNSIFKLYYIFKNILISIAQDIGTYLGAKWEREKKSDKSKMFRYIENKIIKGG